MKNPENYFSRSQDLEPIYHDAGQYYFIRIEALKEEGTLLLKNTSPLILPETHVQDIDNDDDWEMAELKYNLRFNK